MTTNTVLCIVGGLLVIILGVLFVHFFVPNDKDAERITGMSGEEYKQYVINNHPEMKIVETKINNTEETTSTYSSGGTGGRIPKHCTTIWRAIDPKNPDAGGPGGCY